MRHVIALLLCTGAAAAFVPAHACEHESGSRSQSVHLSWNGERIKHWRVSSPEIEAVDLPNGFRLGVKIEPASPAKYAKLRARTGHVAELVHISLFDLGGQTPVLLTRTWGGANSLQGFGARGGADRVDQLGDPGVELTLLNPVCADTGSMAANR